LLVFVSTSQVLALQTGVWDQIKHGLMRGCEGEHGLAQVDDVSPRQMAEARRQYDIKDDSLTNKTDVYRAAVRMMLDQVRCRTPCCHRPTALQCTLHPATCVQPGKAHPARAGRHHHYTWYHNGHSLSRDGIVLNEQVSASFDGMVIFFLEPPTYFSGEAERPCWIFDVIREEVMRPERGFLVIDKAPYVSQGKAAHVSPLGHGYSGPVADALAKTLLVLLCAFDKYSNTLPAKEDRSGEEESAAEDISPHRLASQGTSE
jgi:hypothetical protein